MLKILITYGTCDYKDSLLRLKKDAKQLNLFDKIILYQPSDLPELIKANPLMTFKRGGGYWVWKPYIIWKTLQDYNDAIVVYVDGGCVLHESTDWNYYFDKIASYDNIVFNYRDDFDYNWINSYNCNSPKIHYWTKQNTLLYFDQFFQNKEWRDYNKIWGGFIISKGAENNLIKQWLSISLMHPELVCDPFGSELSKQEFTFVQHRHDQSLITPLAYFFATTNEVLILPEKSESEPELAAVGAKRIKYVPKVTLKTKLIKLIKLVVGEKIYKTLHFYK